MSAYDRQINSPVEGTADRSVWWKNDSQSFFSTFWTFMRCTGCMYVSLPAHDPPVSFSFPPFFVYLLSAVASISALSGDFLEHFARNILS